MAGTTDWDDVGKRFADLGRRLEDTWTACRDDDAARADLRDASDKIKTALDDVAETIDRAIASSEVREATRQATSGVVGALASTLHQVASWIEDATPERTAPAADAASDRTPPGDDGPTSPGDA